MTRSEDCEMRKKLIEKGLRGNISFCFLELSSSMTDVCQKTCDSQYFMETLLIMGEDKVLSEQIFGYEEVPPGQIVVPWYMTMCNIVFHHLEAFLDTTF